MAITYGCVIDKVTRRRARVVWHLYVDLGIVTLCGRELPSGIRVVDVSGGRVIPMCGDCIVRGCG